MATEKAIKWFKSLTYEQKNEIAQEVGISLGTLRNIFYSEQRPSMKTIFKIEKASNRTITRYEIAPEIDWSIL